MNTYIASNRTYWIRRAIFVAGVFLAFLAVLYILVPLAVFAGHTGAGFIIWVHDVLVSFGFPVSTSIYDN